MSDMCRLKSITGKINLIQIASDLQNLDLLALADLYCKSFKFLFFILKLELRCRGKKRGVGGRRCTLCIYIYNIKDLEKVSFLYLSVLSFVSFSSIRSHHSYFMYLSLA